MNGKEELSWSIVIATKGLQGLVDVLDSQEYLDAFGYDPFPSTQPGPRSAVSETPSTSPPPYDEYYRGILGFPQIVFSGGPGKKVPARARSRRAVLLGLPRLGQRQSPRCFPQQQRRHGLHGQSALPQHRSLKRAAGLAASGVSAPLFDA